VYASEYLDPDAVYVDGYMTAETDFGPPNVLDPHFQRYLSFAAHARLARVERLLGPPGTILDVGCGTGEVLAAAVSRGWDATGVELVPESVAIAVQRGLDVRCTRLEDSGLPEHSFDLVTAFHVLEHMPEATDFLTLLARWARPGGHVLVEVPNWNSVARRQLGDEWTHLRPGEHLAHYTTSTLRSTLERAGLDPVRVETIGFLWEGQTLYESLADLGLYRARRVLRPFTRTATRGDRNVQMPTASGRRVLRAIQSAFNAARVGQVVSAVARVPG
jgi:2-polyprenyl-3-methyl-5-hydroxy-6-metoxy-1,4-benzoquinol methylase